MLGIPIHAGAKRPLLADVSAIASRLAQWHERSMQPRPLRTTVIGSYPFPSWLEFACQNLGAFGKDDVAEMQDDAVTQSSATGAEREGDERFPWQWPA